MLSVVRALHKVEIRKIYKFLTVFPILIERMNSLRSSPQVILTLSYYFVLINVLNQDKLTSRSLVKIVIILSSAKISYLAILH